MADQFVVKYGKPYGLACRENSVGTVSEKLMHKMSVQAPPKLTVEKYLIERVGVSTYVLGPWWKYTQKNNMVFIMLTTILSLVKSFLGELITLNM